jgi:hypothetical protein
VCICVPWDQREAGTRNADGPQNQVLVTLDALPQDTMVGTTLLINYSTAACRPGCRHCTERIHARIEVWGLCTHGLYEESDCETTVSRCHLQMKASCSCSQRPYRLTAAYFR